MKHIVFLVLVILLPILLVAGDYTFIGVSNASTDLISETQTAGTWLDISGLTVHVTSGFTTATPGTSVRSTSGGTYFVKYSVSFDATADCDWTIAVDVNGTNYHEITRRIGATSDVGNASGSGLLVLSANDVVKLQVSPSVDATEFTPVDVQLVLVEVKESITAPYYASMSINSTVSAFNVGTLYTIFTDIAQRDVSSGWSATSGVLTCGSIEAAGTYLAIFSFSGEAANAILTDIGISINNADPNTILTQRLFGGSSDIGNVSGCGIITIANGNTIRLKGKAASSKNFDIHFANVTLIKITDAQDAPYASMNIESTTSAFTVSETWTKVINGLANDVTNGTYWTFSDNSLKPVGVSGGYYLVNYYYSITGGSGAEETIIVDGDIGVNNNTEQLDLAIKRKLNKHDGVDIGAAAGTGIVFIDEATDDIAMLLRTPNGADDLRIRKANLSIIRIEKVGDAALPITLSSFTSGFENNLPTLYWTTQSETDNMGFNVYRSISQNLGQSIQLNENEIIEGAGNSTEPTDYSYTDRYSVEENFTYYYWIESVDNAGEIETFGPVSLTIPLGGSNSGTPNTSDIYGLYQNYPNPFNPSTSISFALEEDSDVELIIYNVKGEKVKTILNEHVLAEEIISSIWDGKDASGKHVSSGVYFYKLITETQEYSKKMLMVK